MTLSGNRRSDPQTPAIVSYRIVPNRIVSYRIVSHRIDSYRIVWYLIVSYLCGTDPQTPNHILQSCPTFDSLRRQTWPSPKDAHSKLSGPVETLRQIEDFALLTGFVVLFVGCLTSQQQASVSQERICKDNFTCCHTEIEVADQTFNLTHSILTPGRPVPMLTL